MDYFQVFISLYYNGWQYAQHGISKPLRYQDTEKLKRATDAETCCNQRIAYDRILQAGRFPNSLCLLWELNITMIFRDLVNAVYRLE